MKINGDYVLREVMDEILLVPIGNTALDCRGIISLDPVGAEIWKGLEKGNSIEKIIQTILEAFDVEEDTVRADTALFLQELSEKGFLV